MTCIEIAAAKPTFASPEALPSDGLLIPAAKHPKGTFFDQSIDFRDPEGHKFTTSVLSAISAVEQRKNKRSAAEQDRHYTIVRKIVANAMRCLYYRQPSRVSYLRKADAYPVSPEWLSGRAMARTTDLMQKAGLLRLTRGFHGPENSLGLASTYDCTMELSNLADLCGVKHSSLTARLPQERLVRLRSKGSERVDMDFALDGLVEEWTALLASWNVFIEQQDITAPVSFEEEQVWVDRMNRRRDRSGMPYYRPELIQTALYRSFCGDFEHHGRMYGGWWISAPKGVRRNILINGHTTVELDFSGCAIRMLYHQRGLACPDDPYELKEVAEYERKADLPNGHYRESLKRLLNALINTTERGRPENIFREHDLPHPPVFRPVELRRMMERKHEPIADAFRSGAGLRLHRADSDLALNIITTLRRRGVVALPIHDSFIVEKDKEYILKTTMENEYQTIFHSKPVIK